MRDPYAARRKSAAKISTSWTRARESGRSPRACRHKHLRLPPAFRTDAPEPNARAENAAERRNLRSPMRERWEMPFRTEEPRSGDIYALRNTSGRCRRSAARCFAIQIPKAHALGYVDCAAPRLPSLDSIANSVTEQRRRTAPRTASRHELRPFQNVQTRGCRLHRRHLLGGEIVDHVLAARAEIAVAGHLFAIEPAASVNVRGHEDHR